jgi:hypothetical protein
MQCQLDGVAPDVRKQGASVLAPRAHTLHTSCALQAQCTQVGASAVTTTAVRRRHGVARGAAGGCGRGRGRRGIRAGPVSQAMGRRLASRRDPGAHCCTLAVSGGQLAWFRHAIAQIPPWSPAAAPPAGQHRAAQPPGQPRAMHVACRLSDSVFVLLGGGHELIACISSLVSLECTCSGLCGGAGRAKAIPLRAGAPARYHAHWHGLWPHLPLMATAW